MGRDMFAKLKLILLFGCWFITHIISLQIIFERAEMYYVNDALVKDVVLNVRKLGRKGPRVVNLNFTLVYEVGNNVTMDMLYYEYLHNEYRRTFVETHFKICDMINEDIYTGMAVRNAGLTNCPLEPGVYILQNITIPNIENFPYVWPFEKAKVVGIFSNHKTGVPLVNGSIYIYYKNKNN